MVNVLGSKVGGGVRTLGSRGTGGQDSLPIFGIGGRWAVLGGLLGPLEADGLGGRTWFRIFDCGGGRTSGTGSLLVGALVVEL